MLDENNITRIVKDEGLSYDECLADIEKGGKFVIFRYAISLVAVTIDQYSPIFYVKSVDDINKFKKKYNWITGVFGWWGIPYGPTTSLEAININKNGGIDVTKDVKLNLTREDFEKNEVQLEIEENEFQIPGKEEQKALSKSLEKDFDSDFRFTKIHAGILIKAGEGELLEGVNWYFDHAFDAPTVIGYEYKGKPEEGIELLRKSLSKQFRKNADFMFYDMSVENVFFKDFKGESLRIK